MIYNADVTFADAGTEDLFNGVKSKAASKIPADINASALRKLDLLNRAETLESLKKPPGNHLEALKGDRKGQHSIRINDKYRICFAWTDDGATGVEIVDYH